MLAIKKYGACIYHANNQYVIKIAHVFLTNGCWAFSISKNFY